MEPELVVHPIRWNLAPIAGENHWARNWLSFQSNRGLAPNTLEAYMRGIEIYFAFLAKQGVRVENATRVEVGAYINSLQSQRPQGLSNATVQQRITVVRLFYAYLVEEGVCSRNPALSHSPACEASFPGIGAFHGFRLRSNGPPFLLQRDKSRYGIGSCWQWRTIRHYAGKKYAGFEQMTSILRIG